MSAFYGIPYNYVLLKPVLSVSAVLVSRFLLDLQAAHRHATGGSYLSQGTAGASRGFGADVGTLVFAGSPTPFAFPETSAPDENRMSMEDHVITEGYASQKTPSILNSTLEP